MFGFRELILASLVILLRYEEADTTALRIFKGIKLPTDQKSFRFHPSDETAFHSGYVSKSDENPVDGKNI